MAIQIPFRFVNEERNLFLYLPNDYNESEKSYPVMYFFDGQNIFSDSNATFSRGWRFDSYLDRNHFDIIIVGLECAHEDRLRGEEYCPYHINSHYYGDLSGRGEDTFSWILNEVKPYIDRNFRTLRKRTNTGIAGSSMGGLMSLYGIIKYNAVFSKAACISPSVVNTLPFFTADTKEADISIPTKIFLSYGEMENKAEHVKKLSETILDISSQLTDKKAETYYYPHPEGRHNEESWEKEIPIWMNWLYN